MNRTAQSAQAPPGNDDIARRFDEVAELLEAQHANPYRVQAYRNAAHTLRDLPKPAAEILEAGGVEGLRDLPGIGESLARSIEQILLTGRFNLLERLRGEADPERALATVPGIGAELAHRIHEQLDIETLTELEAAAYDGRLEQVAGFGDKRVRGVRESLAGRFRRRPHLPGRRPSQPPADQPPVGELLSVDREYRERAGARTLPRITPRRFNPTHAPWLPVLHTERGGRHYTALYSNTAHAHERGMTHDWVVIYRDDHDHQGQWTVITSRYGPLRERRIVRGREVDCRAYYEAEDGADDGR